MNLTRAAHTLRGLAIDGIQKANSGHPGMPLGAADMAAVLFLKFLKHNPAHPDWPDRDRYVQSAGHGSMLLYGLLHLSGYDVTMEDLQNFRQWNSRTPGHPEVGLTPGVETTTGPLGQGCGNAVGMALAEAMLAARFNRDGFPVVDHRTYVIAGDGDLMEGVSHEVFSLAGHLGLHKLTVLYDSNRITIEGATDLAYTDDVRQRFEGYRWNVLEADGHDHAAIEAALNAARAETRRPTLIICRTHIGKGSPKFQDSAECHGSPLGADEIRATKKALGLPEDQLFHVPAEVRDLFAQRRKEWAAQQVAWERLMADYAKAYPAEAAEYKAFISGALPAGLASRFPSFDPAKPIATRQASGAVLQSLAEAVPNLVGGSADLAPSTNTFLKKYSSVGPGRFEGRNLHFGIREHGMGSVLNGMALHGGWIVYGATFLVFSDYMKPAIRLAAMSHLPVIFLFTHDSIFLGEDGPTHQPVEQLAALRAIPNLVVLRPADPAETAAAWRIALERRQGPTALILSRQAVPHLDRAAAVGGVEQGAYTLWSSGAGEPELILIGTGSETAVALEAGKKLAGEGKRVRVVSMPSWELFERQPESVRESVLPSRCAKRLAVEAGSPLGWERYVGQGGRIVGMPRYGASAPQKVLASEFGFTAERVAAAAREMLAK
ncbi:MAG TPA: transketolase [Kiritimatiellia bacterium]|nr:transketolase [Kiritimatiellia bacterium]HSA17247.1 transketolase [Kiritimatiellia bacterium]